MTEPTARRDAAVDAVMAAVRRYATTYGLPSQRKGDPTEEAEAAVRAAVEQYGREQRIEELTMIPCAGCGQTKGHHVDGKRICGCSISTIQCARCSRLAELERQRGAR